MVRAFVINMPFLVFLFYYRVRVGENLYVAYRLPLLGEMPSGAIFDFALVLIAIVLWIGVRRVRVARILFLAIAVPLGFVVLLFRLIDSYYYASTGSHFNAYVLYGNLTMIEEGLGIVLASPGVLVLAVAVAAHYVVFFRSARYATLLTAIADRASAQRTPLAIGVVGAVVALVAVNAHAILVHPRRNSALKSLSGEYQLVEALPAFFREEAIATNAPVARPSHMYLPEPAIPRTLARSARTPRPDIFLITVESFNDLYTRPAAQLNPALTEDIMPFFRSLDTAGLKFSNVWTASAYTFNGIVSVLCSQYTLSEKVWGHDCLPEVLQHNGYEAFSFISIKQLRPYRYDNLGSMGFDRHHVLDAVGMRHGKKNVYFSFLVDKELFDYASAVADSSMHARNRKPLFAHIATNQMHVPGFFQNTTCKPYPFPSGLAVDMQTRNLLNSARCTDRDLQQFLTHLKRSGLYDESFIVITADHAFNLSFWNNKQSELGRVPLFIKLPKSDPTICIDTSQLASHVDIEPTIIDYLGLSAARPFYGRSLLPGGARGPRHEVGGVSSSRLLSLVTPSGAIFHVHGQSDATPPAAREEMESLFETVLYFDQHPREFERLARTVDAPSRALGASPKGAAPEAPHH